MTILAIDPGSDESAYVLMRDDHRILAFGKSDNKTLLVRLRAKTYGFDTIVIEQVACMGMAVGDSVFETVYFSGRFAEASGMCICRIKRHEVKMNLCHNMRAKDANIRMAIIDRYGGKEKAIGKKATPGPLYGISGDCWSALGVALTFIDTYKPA